MSKDTKSFVKSSSSNCIQKDCGNSFISVKKSTLFAECIEVTVFYWVKTSEGLGQKIWPENVEDTMNRTDIQNQYKVLHKHSA